MNGKIVWFENTGNQFEIYANTTTHLYSPMNI